MHSRIPDFAAKREDEGVDEQQREAGLGDAEAIAVGDVDPAEEEVPQHDHPVPAHLELHEWVANLLEGDAQELAEEVDGIEELEVRPRQGGRDLQCHKLGNVVEERDAAVEEYFFRINIENSEALNVVNGPQDHAQSVETELQLVQHGVEPPVDVQQPIWDDLDKQPAARQD